MTSNSNIDYSEPSQLSFNCYKSTLSWGPIIGGTVIALSLVLLFNLLGLGLGFSVFSPDTNTISGIGIGSIIWLGLTGIISTFIGGWVAGRTTQFGVRIHGALHGLITWGVATLFLGLVATTAASAVLTAGAAHIINKDMTLTMQQNNANQNVISNNKNMDQTNVQVPNPQNPQTRQNIEDASKVLSSIAFATFIMFLLSAIAGATGGYLGGCRNQGEYPLRGINSPNIAPRV